MSEVLPPDHFEPDALMRALVEAGVRFILIGGLAVGVHGVVRATKDIDIVPDPEPENLERLATLLHELGAKQIGVDTELLPNRPTDPDGLAAGGRFQLATVHGQLAGMTTSMTSTTAAGRVTLRDVEPDDAEACAQICFDAFAAVHDHHRFPRDFPVLEAAGELMAAWVPHPSIWGVVAELDGRLVGSNFLDERDPIRGIGPITIRPDVQQEGIGRQLMEAVIEHGAAAPGIRLTQDAFNMRSLGLYESLGFAVKEPLGVIAGRPSGEPTTGVEVRPLRDADLDECEALCRRVHGFERTNELRDAMHAFRPFVAVRDGRIAAYASSVVFWPLNHGVAASEEDMLALLHGAAAAVEEPIELLVPLRSELFRRCLGVAFRLVKPVNLMARGEYHEPRGSWFPSVLH